MSSPRFTSGCGDRRHHFLDACFLCKKPLAKNENIFMYRGDNPFCSKECRWEQMDMDEALEKERVVHSASAAAAAVKRKPTSNAVASGCSGESRHFAADTAIFVGY